MPILTLNRPIVAPVSRRRARYQADPDYREKAMNMSRKSYRIKNGVVLRSCLYSLDFVDKAAIKQEVQLPDGTLKHMPVFSIPKTAQMLQKIYQTFFRWLHNGVVPRPVLMSQLKSSRPFPVYHLEEVRALIEIIGEHEKIVSYFRKDHVEVRKRIEQRFAEIRTSLGIIKG